MIFVLSLFAFNLVFGSRATRTQIVGHKMLQCALDAHTLDGLAAFVHSGAAGCRRCTQAAHSVGSSGSSGSSSSSDCSALPR